MTKVIRLTAIMAVLATAVLAIGGSAEAHNRKVFTMLKAEAEAYCAEISKNNVYACSVEKCPCGNSLREVRRFDKIRSRPVCVCTPDKGRATENKADATDFCVQWNHDNAKEGDRCFVEQGHGCPKGTSELNSFDRSRGRGPEQTACRGVQPTEEDADSKG